MQHSLVESFQLSWLRAFIAVHETGSFTAAAREVHRAQSRVSAQVAQLESTLGVQLFTRGWNHVQLTPEGSEFLGYARSALLQLESGADAVATHFGEVRGRLTIKAFPGAAAFLVAPLIRHFHSLYPAATVTLKEGGADAITDVARSDVDVALFPFRPAAEPRVPNSVTAIPLFLEPIVAALPAGHPLAGQDRVSPAIFDSTTAIMTGSPGTEFGQYGPLLEEADVHPSDTYVVGQPTTAAALVDAGAGIAIVPSLAAHMLNTDGRVKLLRIADERFIRTVYILVNKTRHYPPVVTRFLDELRRFDPGHWVTGVPEH